jgi:multiple sugar transport system permease protein
MRARPDLRPRVRAAIRHLLGLALSALFLLPLAFMVSMSLRSPGLPPARTIEWLPDPISWENYRQIFTMLPLARYTFNSLTVAAVAVPLTLLTASWAGFAMAQLGARWRSRLVTLSVALLLVPIAALWLTRFVLFTWLGLTDSYAALAAPALMGTSPLFVLLFYWAYVRLPAEMFESARLEGAGPLTQWWRVAVPLSTATALAVGILSFLVYWSDFINPLLYLKSPERYTLPVGVSQLQQMDRTNWPLLMAAAVVMTIPAIGVFALVQRYFLRDDALAFREEA